jgi:hypothetical protein
LDRLKLGFKGIKASLSAPPPAEETAAKPEEPATMEGKDGGKSAGALFSSWAEKAKKIVAEKVAYDPVPKDDSSSGGDANVPDEEKGEGNAWTSWAKATANRVGKQVAGAAEEARQNLEKAADKAKGLELAQQAKGLQSHVTKGFGGVADRATQAREVFAEKGKAASASLKDLGGKSAAKLSEAKDKAAAKAKEAKDKAAGAAAGAASAAKNKLSAAGESIKGLGSLAMSPAKLAKFAGVFMVGIFLISMSLSFLPMLPIAPQKFALLFAFGSVTMLSSFAILKGPQAFLTGMAQREQLPFSVAYGVGLVGTLVATIIMRSFLLTAVFGLMQAGGLLYFLASYVPGGKAAVNFCSKLCSKAARAALCRR